MIDDPEEHARITNKALCFHCGKTVIDLGAIGRSEISYRIEMRIDLNVTCASKTKQNGNGAILRFCVTCFSEVAGEEYMFDQTIWK
ncbi:MAG: hypothetical protein Q7R33_09500 [Nitrosarchaeum sp.]|nr:hypothetical protein [Nitrosarchaeum sp.]